MHNDMSPVTILLGIYRLSVMYIPRVQLSEDLRNINSTESIWIYHCFFIQWVEKYVSLLSQEIVMEQMSTRYDLLS